MTSHNKNKINIKNINSNNNNTNKTNDKFWIKKEAIYPCKVFVRGDFHLIDIFNNIHKINKYLVKSVHKLHLVSKLKLYEISETKVYRMDIYDGPSEEYMLENIPMLGELEVTIDQSYIKVAEEEFQIPINHKVDKTLSKEYSLKKDDLVKLVIQCDDNEEQMVRQYYFTIPEKIDRKILNETIISFLHELNLC